MILARSFARIHETNLKVGSAPVLKMELTFYFYFSQKQGILPLWFADKAAYLKIGSGDVLETIGLEDVFSGRPDAAIKVKVIKPDNSSFEICTRHTMSSDQLKWLKSGSALNYIRSSSTV